MSKKNNKTDLASDSLVPLEGPFRMTNVGLEIAPETTFEQWAHAGATLGAIVRVTGFALGDWLNYGDKHFQTVGEARAVKADLYQTAMKATGMEIQTLRNLASVASKWPLDKRSDKVSFTAHQELAYLPEPMRDRLLALTQEKDLTMKELRDEIKKAKNPLPAPAPAHTAPGQPANEPAPTMQTSATQPGRPPQPTTQPTSTEPGAIERAAKARNHLLLDKAREIEGFLDALKNKELLADWAPILESYSEKIADWWAKAQEANDELATSREFDTAGDD